MLPAPPPRPLRSVLFDVMVVLLAVPFAALDASLSGWWMLIPSLPMAVALLWRRHWPVLVFCLVLLLDLGPTAGLRIAGAGQDSPLVVDDFAVLVAMYSAVKYAWRLRDGLVIGAVVLTEAVAGAALVANGRLAVFAFVLISSCTVCVAIWLFGLAERNRRLFVESLKERAVTADRERDHLTRLAVAEERAAIARELHDVVAHSLAVMIVQSDGARCALDRDPAAARAALETVSTTGREALVEMRQLVAVLRGTARRAEPPTVGELPVVSRPRAALDQLGEVAERARSAGLHPTVTIAGEPPRMSAGIELAVYRIVQESITNAIKHAGPESRIDLRVTYAPDAVEIQVHDDGAGYAAREPGSGQLPSGGNGLVGLRERVALYGGVFAAGAKPGGGWLVHARIPVGTLTRPAGATDEASG